MTKNVTKKLTIALLSVFVALATIMGVATVNKTPYTAKAADETTYEDTYLTGFRSNGASVMHFYWRIDGADLGFSDNDKLADVQVDYTSGGVVTQKQLSLKYTTASTQGVTANLGGTSDRRKGAVASNHPCIYVNISPNAVTGDTFTIPAGTVLGNKYKLTQDYTLTFNGSNWLFTEESAIPVEITGYRSGNSKAIYLYGGKILDNYYVKDITLNSNVTLDYLPVSGEATTITKATIKPETVSCINNGNIKTAAMLLSWSTDCSVGDVIVLKKGTKFDNYVLDRDYRITMKSASDWSVEPVAEADDPILTLTKRGGGNNLLNLFCDETVIFDFVVDEQLNKNAVVYKNGKDNAVLVQVNALAKSGNKPSFCLKFSAAVTSGDVVTIPSGFVVAGYKTDKDYMFKWDGSAWAAVKCDGVNHTYADNFTCHDRVCDCGHVEKATTEHTFAAGTFPCEARVCTTCGDTVEGVGHKWEGEGCEKICSVCKKQAGVHTWDEGTVTTPATCKEEGVKTYNCTKCDATKTEPVPKADHTIAAGAKTCSVCGYRIPYTADDMDEILASDKLNKYVYSDFHVNDEKSEKGHIYNEYTDGVKYGNTYLLNTTKLGEKNYQYEDGHSEYANMLVGFSLNISEWANSIRDGYVYLAAHENGSWGIGFQFKFSAGAKNLRINYKSTDGKQVTFVSAKTMNVNLNEKHYYQVGVMKNDDGSIFAFAFIDGELFLSGTLSTEQLEQYANEATHNGLGGAASIVFNGSAAAPSVKATICDKEHKLPAETFACKDYDCEICGTTVAHTAEHTWGKETLKQAGTCTVKDKLSKTCGVCGEEIVYDGNYRHEWDKEHPTIVTKRSCNNVDEVVKYPCKLCGEQSDERTLEGTGISGAHDYKVVTVTEATCVIKGKVKLVCSKCQDEKDEQETPVNADNHKNVSAVAGKAATCTESGIKDHFVCSDCDKKLLADGDGYVTVGDEDLVIAALGHDYKRVEAVAPTCEEAGVKEHYKCDRCNKLFVKNGETYTEAAADELIEAATGHDYKNGVCKNCGAKDPDYVAPKKKGCKSDVNAVAIITLFAIIIAAGVIKKKYAGKN